MVILFVAGYPSRDCEGTLNELTRTQKQKTTTTMIALQHPNVISGPFPQWHLDLPLLGRASDLPAIQTALAGGYRAATIVGMSGVGKTRLAVEVASTVRFTHGIVWHSVNPQAVFSELITQIRVHLRLDPAVSDDDIWAALGHYQVLLIIDGAEECVEPEHYVDCLNRLNLNGGTR